MKKTLVSALTTALVVGAASTSFAATNPFSDVPQSHWAYEAVTDLAEKGVLEGMGDGTFQGSRSITRYEVAQAIARAMAKNTATGADKAMLDKLAAEFHDELSNLGVRVDKLERNADMVKWNGEARYTYTSVRHENTRRNNNDEFLLRLEPTAEVNQNWKVKARLDAANNMQSDVSGNVRLQRIWAQGNYGKLQLEFGKFPDGTNYDKNLMLNNQMSGAAVTYGKDVQIRVQAGRLDLASDSQLKNLRPFGVNDNAANFQSVAVTGKLGKLSGTVAGYHLTSNVLANGNHADYNFYKNNKSVMGIWEVAGSYRFDKNVALSGAYAENAKADYYHKAGMVQVDYKGAQKANKGTWGAYLAYRHIGAGVAIDPVVDGVGYNQKGWEVGTQYTFLKNLQGKAIYFNGKDLAGGHDASKLFGRVEFFF